MGDLFNSSMVFLPAHEHLSKDFLMFSGGIKRDEWHNQLLLQSNPSYMLAGALATPWPTTY